MNEIDRTTNIQYNEKWVLHHHHHWYDLCSYFTCTSIAVLLGSDNSLWKIEWERENIFFWSIHDQSYCSIEWRIERIEIETQSKTINDDEISSLRSNTCRLIVRTMMCTCLYNSRLICTVCIIIQRSANIITYYSRQHRHASISWSFLSIDVGQQRREGNQADQRTFYVIISRSTT
jgi:hypothetical protein